ncbi:MAG: hypothetical protein L0H59_18095, partial [Tomitella sp.]|nr:hypothetical protein [Tomitella sp.]
DRLLAAAWLASLRSARTRRSYAGDLLGWRAWLPSGAPDLRAAGSGPFLALTIAPLMVVDSVRGWSAGLRTMCESDGR